MVAKVHHRRSVRGIYLALGFLSLAVAAIGIVLPLIPTTGPVLLAGYFFARSSERFNDWLLGHPRFGPLLRDYQAGLGIPVRAKVTAAVMIVATFGLSMVWIVRSVGGRILLGALAVGIVTFIVSRPTRRAGATEAGPVVAGT